MERSGGCWWWEPDVLVVEMDGGADVNQTVDFLHVSVRDRDAPFSPVALSLSLRIVWLTVNEDVPSRIHVQQRCHSHVPFVRV